MKTTVLKLTEQEYKKLKNYIDSLIYEDSKYASEDSETIRSLKEKFDPELNPPRFN